MSFDALERALVELAASGELTREQAEQVRERYMVELARPEESIAPTNALSLNIQEVHAQEDHVQEDHSQEDRSRRSLLGEIGGYVGGAFTLVATLVILGSTWSQLSNFGRIITLLALTLIFAAVALLLHRGEKSPVRARLVATLFSFAGISGAATAGVATPWQKALVASIIGSVIVDLAYFRNRTSVGHVSLFAFKIFATIAFLDAINIFNSAVAALLFAAIAIAWYFFTRRGILHEKMLGFTIASATAFVSAEIAFIGSSHIVGYLLFLGTGVGGYLLYSRTRLWPFLVAAVAASTFGIAQLIITTLGGALGVSIGLLGAGLVLLGASTYILRTRRSAPPQS